MLSCDFGFRSLLFIFLDTNARNERHLAALHYSKTGSFEIIHGLLDRIMELLEVPFTKDGTGYFICPHDGNLMNLNSSM